MTTKPALRQPSVDLSAPESQTPLAPQEQPIPAKDFAFEPGVYFGMSFDDYLRIPYLNSSGIKDLLICETDYWENSPLNPYGAEEDDDTKAKREGRAFHKRILEGREAFNAAYAPKYMAPKGLQNVLYTNKHMEKLLKSLGVKGYLGKTKQELIPMVLDADPSAKIYDHMEAEYCQQFDGQEFLDEATIRQIEFANQSMQFHPDLKVWFAGGYPEVTVIFDAFGVRFKVRFDYAKIGSIGDLKTFANQMKRKLRSAVNTAMRSYSYHISAALYLMGAGAAQDLIRAGKVYDFTGHPDWLDDFASTPVTNFYFAFIKKGQFPVVQPAVFAVEPESGYGAGLTEIMEAVDLYKKGQSTYGKDLPWVTIREPIILQANEYLVY